MVRAALIYSLSMHGLQCDVDLEVVGAKVLCFNDRQSPLPVIAKLDVFVIMGGMSPH